MLDGLFKAKHIQAHQLKAATWLATLPKGSPWLHAIALDCAGIVTPRKFSHEPFSLLMQAAITTKPFHHSEANLGVLREALNVAHRVQQQFIREAK